MDQSADRCHRIGQRGAVLVRHLVFDGTVDSMLAKKAVEKTEVIESIMGDDFCDDKTQTRTNEEERR
jgi:SNF2 family DNA or RNA helicase